MTTTIETTSAPAGDKPAGARTPASRDANAGEAQTLEGGSYDVIRRRLLEQAAELGTRAEALNERRKKTFGGSDLVLVAHARIRTENNCVARDVVSVAGQLLFGFQVFLGLRAETNASDILAFYSFKKTDGADEWELAQLPFDGPGAFLADERFVKELRDTFKYMRDARLLRLQRTDMRLFAAVQIGATPTDHKVFRWAIDASGKVTYVDARGDEEMVPPRQHSFDWIQTRREDQVSGAHPHVNILDTVFVETVGGDLTVKVENNTRVGRGIYSEPVEDVNQTLDDGDIAYARVGPLILLKIKPFREKDYRYFVFDTRARTVVRIDAIGRACHELPEDHGIVFPGGYYLNTGERKQFDGEIGSLEFDRLIKSPNGEDVLYTYHARDPGEYLLLPYNLIRKEIVNPIRCHGYSLAADGTLVIFRAESEPTRVHPLQVWRTPFTTAEYAAVAPRDGSYLSKVGNADLVRGISDALSIRKLAAGEKPSRLTYEDLAANLSRVGDAHYWLGHAEAGDMGGTLAAMRKTVGLLLDEFDKVEAIAKRAAEALVQARAAQDDLFSRVQVESLVVVEDYLRALSALRQQRGQLITLKEVRGIDLAAVGTLEKAVADRFDAVGRACVEFFLKEDAFKPLVDRLDAVVNKVEKIEKAVDLAPFGEELDVVQQGLTLLSEVVGNLKIDDTNSRTRILEGVSTAFSQQNRARAVWQGRRKDLSVKEGKAEFAARFRLFSQAITGALALCDTPEACDEQLSKLLLSLEELEGRFGEFDEFTGDLAQKREELNDAIGARRQQLLDERQRRAQNLMTAADRILSGVGRRAKTFTNVEELNAYFASDAMVLKLGDLAEQLRALGDSVRTDELQSRLKSARQDAIRALRDKTELSDGGEGMIKLGQHRFSVHTQALELVLVPRDGAMTLHVAGTDYFEPLEDPILAASRELWDQSLPSESPEVYRGEFLAASMLFDAENSVNGLTVELLAEAARDANTLLERVRAYAQPRLDEGYERGVHDVDAAKILERLIALRASSGLLRYAPDVRAIACLYWAGLSATGDSAGSSVLSSMAPASPRAVLQARAKSVGRLRAQTGNASAQATLASELESPITSFAATLGIKLAPGEAAGAARYLVLELTQERPRFTASATADSLSRGMLAFLDEHGSRRAFEDELKVLANHPAARIGVAIAYMDAFVGAKKLDHARGYVREAAAMIVDERAVDREPSAAPVDADVTGLLGSHPRIQNRTMRLAIDEFLARLPPFIDERARRHRAFRAQKAEIVEREKRKMRMSEFAPKVLTSFVRNRLIDQVYLPLVGANLAKQIGAAGANKRTDLMGMLLLVSPPGYGKTTLMEYVASKLGLVFMKVNGPSLGHEVTSLDPQDAKSATARQEVEKINLAFEMGNNVMLYLDDIQHANTELLQKFISLCDAQRRVEGVWRGRSRTYDLRGKKFCVVMAGNPYTETGARFQIPDMLANRADTYNLGDILNGADELFASSYIENALTSNQVLAPLATRDPGDVFKLMRMAHGEELPLTELSHGYAAAEVEEITAVLKHLFEVQKVLLKVNHEYIASASQEDAYRTEPPFKLQGSYRNMNKLAEKVVSAMNAEERERLIDDHYTSESQTLTTGAEQNLLKLAEIRGRMDDVQRARWAEIKDGFARTRRAGGKGDDPISRVTGALGGLDEQLQRIRESIALATATAAESALAAKEREGDASAMAPHVARLEDALRALAKPTRLDVHVDSGASAGLIDVVREHARAMDQVVTALTEMSRAGAANGGGGGGANGPGNAETMQKLDALGALVQRLGQRLSSAPSTPRRFDVTIDATSPSNFFRGLEGPGGGVFVATYAKLPPLGSPLTLHITLPGGVKFEAESTVDWLQDGMGDDGTTGFGARFTFVPEPARPRIAEFVRLREPLIRE